MNKFIKATAVTIIAAATLFCMKHQPSAKQLNASAKCSSQATTVRISEAQPFSIISLLTSKFM